MTIANYNSLPNIRINYIKRRDGISALVVNQETKEELALSIGGGLTISDDYFDIDITDILGGVNVNSTFSVSLIDVDSKPIYRDIVVFDGRLDTESDYEQNDETQEYVFV